MKASKGFKSMRDHLNAFSKAVSGKPYQSDMTILHDNGHLERGAGHKKRTNVMFADFAKTPARDTKMYHLSDGYNLELGKHEETYQLQR